MQAPKSTRSLAFLLPMMLIAVLLLFAAYSCDDSADPFVPDGDEDGALTDGDFEDTECFDDEDCTFKGEGYNCFYGRCVTDGCLTNEEAQCVLDSDCGYGKVCSDSCVCEDAQPDGDNADGDNEGLTDGDKTCDDKPCILVKPTEHSFGYIVIGRVVKGDLTIENIGATDLNILDIGFKEDSSDAFSLDKSVPKVFTVKSGETYKVGIIYAPANPGPQDAYLKIVCNDLDKPTVLVHLYGEYKGRTTIDVYPDPKNNPAFNFGTIEVGTLENQLNIRVKNLRPEGSENEEMNKVLTIYQIQLDPPTNIQPDYYLADNIPTTTYIQPGNEFVFSVFYKPTTEGIHDVKIKIFNDADVSPYTPGDPVEVNLTGQGVIPKLCIEPNPVDFQKTTVNYENSQEVALRSCGGGTIKIDSIEWQDPKPDDMEIVKAGAESAVIPGGRFVIFRVKYTPKSIGFDGGVILVKSNDSELQTRQLRVQGQGVASSIGVDPTRINFNEVLVNTVATEEVCIKNFGMGDLELKDTVYTPDSGPFSTNVQDKGEFPKLIKGLDAENPDPNGNEWCFKVEYRPTVIQQGYVDQGTLKIETNNPSTPFVEVSLSGTPVFPLCEFSVVEDPNFVDTIDFKEVNLETTKALKLRITNEGGWQCEIKSLMFGPNTSSDFSFFPPLIPAVSPGGYFDISVSYSPRAYPGPDTGSIKITTNDARSGYVDRVFSLMGSGVNPTIFFDPSTAASNPYKFGEVLITTCSDKVPVKIYNTGIGTLDVTRWYEYQIIGCRDCWIIEDLVIPPTAHLRNHSQYPDEEINFTVKFCALNNTAIGANDLTLEFTSTDNNKPKSYVFFRAVGADCKDGFHTCDPLHPCGYYCNRPANSPPYEICDGYDNDCDCLVDEDFGIFKNPGLLNDLTNPANRVTCDGVGECGAGYLECAGNFVSRCSTDPGGSTPQASVEYCDNLDNDCDGETDEDFMVGELCAGVGECGIGHWKCKPNDTSGRYCDANDNGTPEKCDGKDNDCDGKTDNGIFFIFNTGVPAQRCLSGNCLGNPCQGQGGCGEGWGFYECLNAQNANSEHPEITDPKDWIQCCSDPKGTCFDGSYEVCNTKDDNCNGLTDESFNIGAACDGVGECGPGLIECDPKNYQRTICSTDMGGSNYNLSDPAHLEICDGRDNNCDDQTDEGFNIGGECLAKGVCGLGRWECKNDGSDRRCSTGPGGSQYAGTSEKCDDLDNDCDGETDETFNVGYPCVGAGACGIGEIKCKTLSTVCCSVDFGCGDYSGSKELCDGLDNDCDGYTDEDYSIGAACDGKGECGPGIGECDGINNSICSTDFGGSEYSGSTETCDGLDNDCDGFTDEDYFVGMSCIGVGQCGPGVWECAGPNGKRCSTMPGGSQDQSTREICDHIDNDCNGYIDNGINTGGSDPNNCGDCGVVCDVLTTIGGQQVRTGVAQCNEGNCEILSCNSGRYDVDQLYSSGCECTADEYDSAVPAVGNSCAGAVWSDPNILIDNDKRTALIRGNLAPLGDVDWFKFQASDGPDSNLCDEFHVQVAFVSNPNGEFAFEVYRGDCSGLPSTVACLNGNLMTYAVDGKFPPQTTNEPTWGRGQCPCKPEAESQPNFNNCESDSTTFFVKVYRAGSAGQTASCNYYEIEVSNGAYSSN